MAERLMTYAEMEVTLRRTPEAVRQLVKRKRWRRIVGNDRKARIDARRRGRALLGALVAGLVA